jgi:hypothetical protein
MKRLLIHIGLVLLASCSGSKEVVKETPVPTAERPSWVVARPSDGRSYIGVGIASKTINPTDFVQVAKKNALQDLAGEISVNVSANSMLYQLERNYGYTEEFQSAVRVTTDLSLEGFEIVDTWENEREFWIYYRLDKEQYARTVREKKERAISQSVDFYNKALELKAKSEYDRALSLLISAFESVRPYLNDALEVQLGDQTVYYGNELLNTYLDWINEIQVVALESEITFKQGKMGDQAFTVVKVEDRQGRNLRGVPILFGFSGHRRLTQTFISDEDGLISYPVPRTAEKPGRHEIRATLNLEMIVTGATQDKVLTDMLTRPQTQLTVIPIQVIAPSFYIESVEKSFGAENNARTLARTVEEILLKNDLKIAPTASNADFIIRIETDTEKGGTSYNFYSVFLNGSIQVFEGDGLVYSYAINRVKGVQNNYQRASVDAYNEAAEYLEYEVMRKLLQDIKGNEER